MGHVLANGEDDLVSGHVLCATVTKKLAITASASTNLGKCLELF